MTAWRALAVLQRYPECDLVVLDWRLPKIDGGDVLSFMRAEEQLTQVPVIVVSGDDRIAKQFDTVRSTAFLQKPLEPDVLLASIARQLTHGIAWPRAGALEVRPFNGGVLR